MPHPPEVPFWALSSSQPFRYAPAPVRRAAGAIGVNAKWFAHRTQHTDPHKVEAVFWSSRRYGQLVYLRK